MTDILDTIDGALGDWTSSDAMRWTPEPPEDGPSFWPLGTPMGLRARRYIEGVRQPLNRRYPHFFIDINGSVWQFHLLIKALPTPDPAIARRSAMRAAYHHKTRGRRR